MQSVCVLCQFKIVCIIHSPFLTAVVYVRDEEAPENVSPFSSQWKGPQNLSQGLSFNTHMI